MRGGGIRTCGGMRGSDQKEIVHPAVESLFQWARKRVTKEDIVDFSPGDPGYGEYVETWEHLRVSGVIPKDLPFEVSEVIGLTGWADAEEYREPACFRRYRRFTTSVAVALLHEWPYGSDCFHPGNYIARHLVIDL